MQHQSYAVNSSTVISEIIDGEAIIMDLKTGAYFSADGFGAQVWRGVTLGASREQLCEWAAACYPAEASAAADVSTFLDHIVEHALATAHSVEQRPAVELERVNGRYEPPRLSVHQDMEDLIMLDPIHDVSETTGWPIRKVE